MHVVTDTLSSNVTPTVDTLPAALAGVGDSVHTVQLGTRHVGADGAAAADRTHALAALVDGHHGAWLVHLQHDGQPR